jgi:hypothetical protein
MDTQSARNYILTQAPKTQDVATPFWPDLNGQVALRDMPGADLIDQSVAQMSGNLSASALPAAIVCKSLILKDTGERIFQDTDRDAVAQLGSTVLKPLFEQVQSFFGLGQNVDIEQLKKSLGTTTSNSLGTSSVTEASIVP